MTPFLRAAAALAVAAFLCTMPSALAAQGTASAGASVRDSIPNNAYQGWKQYEVNCARCHGEFGVGSSFAPSLVVSLKEGGTVPDQATFVTTVCQGRKEKGMPSWCEAGMEMEKILNIYAYLKLRADGKVRPLRPAVKSDG